MPLFNVRKVRGLIWAVGLLALGLDGWTFRDIWAKKSEGQYKARTSDYYDGVFRSLTLGQAGSGDAPFYDEERRKALWEARVDGSQAPTDQPAEVDTGPAQPEIVVEELSTVLEVSLVLYSPDPLFRRVALTYLPGSRTIAAAHKDRRLHRWEGEPLEPPYDTKPYFGKVKTIGIQEVVFEWAGEEVTLNPGLGREGTSAPLADFEVGAVEDPVAHISSVPERSVEVTPGHWLLGTADLEDFRSNAQRVLSEDLSVRTIVPKGGGRSRILLTRVEDGSRVKGYGFAKNDQIISINGFPMTSVSGAINWFQKHPDETLYVVVYERGGKTLTKTFHSK